MRKGLFDKLKKEPKSASLAPVTYPALLGAVAAGTFVTMAQIPDEVFSTGVLGTCCGIEPTEGKVYASIDGKISQVADELHAIGIDAGDTEILIHVEVDTVSMNGDRSSAAVKLGQPVKKVICC